MDAIDVEIGATMALAFLSAGFCTQPETFPVFLAWARDKGVPLNWTPERLAPLVRNLRDMMEMADGVQ